MAISGHNFKTLIKFQNHRGDKYMKTTTQNQETPLTKIQIRRNDLKVLSKDARIYRDSEKDEETTINECILELFYPEINREDLNTFEGWRKEGYKVKKGEKSINLWGRPRKAKQQEEDDEYKFYPIVYLFHRSQVEPMKHRQPEEVTA